MLHIKDRSGANNLAYLTKLGARTRRSNYFRALSIFTVPIIITIFLIILIYAFFMLRAGRTDYANMVTIVTILAFVPILSALTLSVFRPTGAPILNAIAVTTVLFSFVVSTLSALRFSLSYQALTFCYFAVVFMMAYANARFSFRRLHHVAILSFPKIEQKLSELNLPVVSDISDLNRDISVLLIDPLEHHQEQWAEILAESYLRGISVVSWTWYSERRFGRMDIETFSISHLAFSPSQLIYARLKRFIDILFVLLSLPIAIPLMLFVAIYIYCADRGPVLFIQDRRGYGGIKFRMVKFRTMYQGTAGGSTQPHDPRIITGCRFIRRLRLDELPQIYNILRGEMSWIGPRPVPDYVVESACKIEPKYEMRMLVQPGITGWAQVSYNYAGNVDEEIKKLSYDLYYIKNLSFDLDLLIIFKTISKIFSGIGAR